MGKNEGKGEGKGVMIKEVREAQTVLLKIITNIQLAIYLVMMILLTGVVIYTVYQYLIYLFTVFAQHSVLDIDAILGAFSFFLIILIGLELMDTVKSFVTTHKVNVNIFITLALIAACRKIIVLDLGNEGDDLELIGLGIIIFALAAGYYILKKADLCIIDGTKQDKPDKKACPSTEKTDDQPQPQEDKSKSENAD